MWTIRVAGNPKPKGSLVPFIDKKSGRARVKEDDAKGEMKAWRKLLTNAGELMRRTIDETLVDCPVGMRAVFVVPRPPSVPLAKRVWPIPRGSGDVDKLERVLLDAWQDALVFADDAQVVDLHSLKAYPDTPNCPDRLDRPGATITIWRLDA